MSKIIIPYAPRSFQHEIHNQLDRHRWSVLVLHRRAGKSVLLINHLIRAAMTSQKEQPRFAYVAPFMKQAKQLAWDYFKKFCEPIPSTKYHESELKIDLPNGARIRLYGADNAEALRGIYLDGCVLDEYGTIDPGVFTSILRPALSDREGWGVFSGTPNGRNHFYDAFRHAEQNRGNGWYSLMLKSSETGIISEVELADARKLMTEEEFLREFECSWDSIIGKRIYPEFRRSLHVATTSLLPQHTENLTVYRGWDNTGLSPAIVLSYLTNTGQWRVFKEFCFFDVSIMDATEAMLLWCNQNLHPRTIYVDYADPAGKNRDSTKMSPRDYIIIKAREMGHDLTLIDGIQTWKVRRESVANRLTKLVNGEPALLVDPCCTRLIEGFDGAYAYKEIAALPGQYKEEPVKNDSSHCLVGDTLVDTPFGSKMIKDIEVGDYVSTPFGPQKVTATMSADVLLTNKLEFSDGSIVQCTTDHEFPTVNNLIVLSNTLQYNTTMVGKHTQEEQAWKKKFENSTESSSTREKNNITSQQGQETSQDGKGIFIGTFGRFIMGLSRTVMQSIILTTTHTITRSKISNSSIEVTMLHTTGNTGQSITQKAWCQQVWQCEKLLNSGIDRLKVAHGTASMVKRVGKIGNVLLSLALYAVRPIKVMLTSEKLDIAAWIASKKLAGQEGLIMRCAHALFAKLDSQSTNIQELKPAVRLVRKSFVNEPCRVYDITVENVHVFYANGILTHNCHDATQYIATRLFVHMERNSSGELFPLTDQFDDVYDDSNNYSDNQTGRSAIGGY